MTTPALKPLRIFCSYARRDEEHLELLRMYLIGLRRQGLIEEWHDREILPGQEWEQAIDENLKTSDIILLLISPRFVASDYAYEREMQQAVERHDRGEARVIPIIVQPADWEWAPFGKLQALPKDARPITTWPNQDEAWLDVARGIRKVANQLFVERQERAAREAEPRSRLDESTPTQVKVLETSEQTAWLKVTEIGLEYHIDDRRPGQPSGHRWTLTKAQAREILSEHDYRVNPGWKRGLGLFDVGPRRDWVYSERLYPEPSLLESKIQRLLVEVST